MSTLTTLNRAEVLRTLAGQIAVEWSLEAEAPNASLAAEHAGRGKLLSDMLRFLGFSEDEVMDAVDTEGWEA